MSYSSGIQQWIKETKIPAPLYVAFERNKLYICKLSVRVKEKKMKQLGDKEEKGWDMAILK